MTVTKEKFRLSIFSRKTSAGLKRTRKTLGLVTRHLVITMLKKIILKVVKWSFTISLPIANLVTESSKV